MEHLPEYYKYLKPDKPDDAYDKFNNMISVFDNNPETIQNKNGFIKDSILYNQSNPYLIHYEEFNGKSYPIISILKGTLLFTGRIKYESTSDSQMKLLYHLYKLHGNDTLDKYKNNIASTLTYFYPTPFMSPVVNEKFEMMDIVTLTEDARLLCMIGPSPIISDLDTRYGPYVAGIDDDDEDDYDYPPYQLPSRKKVRELIHGLKLNGFIGISEVDAVNSHTTTDAVNNIREKIDFDTSLLVRASCFKNRIEKTPNILDNTFIENVFHKRIYGIPEVVLIPYNYHKYPTPERYREIYNYGYTQPNFGPKHFIFNSISTIKGKDAYELGTKVEKILIKYFRNNMFVKSAQAYPLFTMLASTANNYAINTNMPITLDEVSFIKSYETPSSSKCAFETGEFYKRLSRETSGGSVIVPSQPFQPSFTTMQNKIVNKNKGDIVTPDPVKNRVNTENVFYSEVGDIPIFFIKKRSEMDGGKNKKKQNKKKQNKKKQNKKTTKRGKKNNKKSKKRH